MTVCMVVVTHKVYICSCSLPKMKIIYHILKRGGMGGMIYDSNPVQAACIALVMHPDRGPTHSKSLDTDTSIIGTVAAQDADHFDTCRL